MHWIFGHWKDMPRHPAVFRFHSPPAVITAQCDTPFNIPLYQCAFCSVTAHAHRKSRVRSNNAPTGSFYVVYLFLFAVALLLWHAVVQLYWTTLVKSPSLIWSTLCSHALIIIALPGFLYFYTFSLHRIIISIHFPLIYAIWWALTHITRSYLCMNEWQRCAFSFTFMHLADTFIQSDLQCIQAIHVYDYVCSLESNPQPFALLTQCSTTEPQEHFTTHTHTLKRTWRSWWFQPLQSQWGHKHTYIISRTALRVTSSAFHRFIWVKLASYHVHIEM